jgi:chaperone modulatory protein CbpM
MTIIGRTEFLARAQLDSETLELWIGEEWLIPAEGDADTAFTEADLARARLIRDLTGDLGVNAEGVGIVLNLVDQVHGLRRTLAGVLRLAREQPLQPESGPS